MDKSKLVVAPTPWIAAGAVRAQAQVTEVSIGGGGANVVRGLDRWSTGMHSASERRVRHTQIAWRSPRGRADTDLVTDFMMPVGVRASVGVVVPFGANK